MVISPWELRPPLRFLLSTSAFSGVCFVNSLLSSMVTNRREAVYGLKPFSGIVLFLLQILRVLDHLFIGAQLDIGFFPVAPVPFRAAAPAKLPVKDRRAHSLDFDLEDFLHRFLDFG